MRKITITVIWSHATGLHCLFADGKYKVDLKEKKPLIKTVAIQYCTEHAPKSNEAEEQ